MLKQAEVKSKYLEYAINYLVIKMDKLGAYANVPSQTSEEIYQVRLDESSKVPYATDCQCPHHQIRHAYCKHMEAIDMFYKRVTGIFHRKLVATPTLAAYDVVG